MNRNKRDIIEEVIHAEVIQIHWTEGIVNLVKQHIFIFARQNTNLFGPKYLNAEGKSSIIRQIKTDCLNKKI